MLKRRGFLLGVMAAPAIVRSASLMPLYVPPSIILYADGVHDDTRALQAWVDGDKRVIWADRREVGSRIFGQRFLIGAGGTPLYIRGNQYKVLDGCEFLTQSHDGWAFIHSAAAGRG